MLAGSGGIRTRRVLAGYLHFSAHAKAVHQLEIGDAANFRMADRLDIAFATESISHIKLNGELNSSGPAASLQIWEICLAGVITESANSSANEGFRVKPKAG
jgi:hypothetical protein